MTATNIPSAVAGYFDGMEAPNKVLVGEVFSTDATVEDDGHIYRGREEILGWLTGPASEYKTTSTVLSAQHDGVATVVMILLEGNFAGGSVELRHAFLVESTGLIEALSISA